MDEKLKSGENSSSDVKYTKPDENGISYYKIESKSGSAGTRKNGLRNGLIILGVIFAGIIILGVSCNRLAGDFFSNIGLPGDMGVTIEEPALPAYDYIAQIAVEGTIMDGNTDMFGYAIGYQHQWTLELINELKNDSNNKGLIIWVDSPGGGVYESDELYLAIKDYQDSTGRPVYSVMGSMAASGGYYISAPADKIIANRNTWTGSIGVTMGTYFDVSEFLMSHGVKTVTITSGRNKAMGSMFEPMTEEQLAIFKSLIDEAYGQFVGIVAEGRNMNNDKVRQLADGRIYTAKQALDAGLIDQIGTLEEATLDMQKSYGLQNCRVEELYYSQNKPFFDFLNGLAGLISEAETGDMAVLKKMMDENSEMMPMYLYQ